MLAGTNGAGKSSLAGALLDALQTPFYNPDAETRALRTANPRMTLAEANSAAWQIGRERLEYAIATRQSFNFETTLGGNTISDLLIHGHAAGLRLRIWYCGLNSIELHIARVRARVRHGGHDIPEARIRERYDASRRNLCRILPSVDELLLFDNSEEADPQRGELPTPTRLLHYLDHRIRFMHSPMPPWAKPIAAVALQLMK